MVDARRGLPVRVIISDSGPLISFAACARLDLLSEFRLPVLVPDVVQAECLRHPEKLGASELAAWFERPDCPVQVSATPFLATYHEAVVAEAANPALHTSLGMGDAAIAWLLRQVLAGTLGEQPTLILTEDGPFGDGVLRDSHPEVHVVSTRAFLRTLENFRLIESAQAVIDEIERAGRRLGRYMADRPGRPSADTRTTWTEVFERAPLGE